IYKKEASSLLKKYNVLMISAGKIDELKSMGNLHIKIFKKPKNIKERIKHLIRIANEVKKYKAEIFHFQNPELLLLIPIIKKAHPKAKIIFDMHEDFEEAIKDKYWIPKPIRNSVAQCYKQYLNFLLKSRLD